MGDSKFKFAKAPSEYKDPFKGMFEKKKSEGGIVRLIAMSLFILVAIGFAITYIYQPPSDNKGAYKANARPSSSGTNAPAGGIRFQ